MRGLTLDAGALIAVSRGQRAIQALLERNRGHGLTLAVPAGALAQVWRAHSSQHGLHVLLGDDALEVVALDRDEALLVGALCARTGASDVVDVSVVASARRREHRVVTSDPRDLAAIDPDLDLIVI